jgi:hypothetical protein
LLQPTITIKTIRKSTPGEKQMPSPMWVGFIHIKIENQGTSRVDASIRIVWIEGPPEPTQQ